MAASLCLLLFATLFPGVLGAVFGQDLHIYVGIGETAEFPLRNFTKFTDSKMLYLMRVTRGNSHSKIMEELLNLTAGAPVQNVKINETWQDRLFLLEGPDDIVAELRNVQPKDTGREVYYRYIQHGNRQGPRMYIIFKTRPPAVSSFSITNAGEDYVNITWKQVEPFDSAPVWYRLEYREAGVVSLSDSWEQTNGVPHDHNPNVTTQMIKVEGLSPGAKYQFRVVSSNRFGDNYSHIQEAGTKESQKVPPPAVSSFSITNAGEDYANITWKQVKPYDSAPVWYRLEYREAGVVSSSDSWNQTDRVSHSANVTTQQIKVEGLSPGAKYQFRVMSSNRFGESYSHIEEAGTKEAQRVPPPAVSSFNITNAGEHSVNITWKQVKPYDSAPVWYRLEYREAGVVSSSDSWNQTDRVSHSANVTTQQIKVEGLSPGAKYQFRVMSSNRFGESYSHIEEAGTKEAQRGPPFHSGYVALIIIGILILPAVACTLWYYLVYRKDKTKKKQRNPQPNSENIELQDPRSEETDPLLDDQHVTTDGVPSGGQPPAAPAGGQPPAAGGQPPAAPAGEQPPAAPAGGQPPAALAGEQPPAAPAGGQPPAAGGQPPAALAGEQPPAAPAGGQPPAALAGEQPPAAPAGGQPPAALAGEQPPAAGGQPPAATGQTDDSILEPLLHYTGTGRGSEVEEGPVLTDRDNGSPDEKQPLLDDDETDEVPSSILDAAFEYRVALYYDKNSENMDGIKSIRATLEMWGFSVYDLHRDGEDSITDSYASSVKNCRHGIFFLPIKTPMAKFRFKVFLQNKLREDEIPERNQIPISFHDDDLKNTVESVQVCLADVEPLPYEERETFNWRKLYRMLAVPGFQFTVEEAKKQLASDSMSVKDLAQKLDIPREVVSNVVEDFASVRAQKEELIRLWMGNEGPVPAPELGAVSKSNDSDGMIAPMQPISSVEYNNLLHNTKDSPTSDDNKEQELTETDGTTNDRAPNGSDYSDEATGSGPTAKKEDSKVTSPPPSQQNEMQQSEGSVKDDNELTPLLHVDESKAVPDVSDEKEISMNVDSPGQKDNESTPLLSHNQPPQPGTVEYLRDNTKGPPSSDDTKEQVPDDDEVPDDNKVTDDDEQEMSMSIHVPVPEDNMSTPLLPQLQPDARVPDSLQYQA
ncbi:uncharacterized protein LOC144907799 isoform X2 [Branchiostoma floridae x Branchiostoma belcheri]